MLYEIKRKVRTNKALDDKMKKENVFTEADLKTSLDNRVKAANGRALNISVFL